MRVSASMESLWQYIQSLSLSERNRVWLADKLLEGTRKEEEETEYISKEEDRVHQQGRNSRGD